MSTLRVIVVASIAGVVLGVGDLLWITTIPYPAGALGNSSALWAVAAFALGAALRLDPRRAALAGVVLLVVAVEIYYVFAIWWLDNAVSNLWSPPTRVWLCFAVVSGGVFGIAGAWLRGPSALRASLATALASGVLVGEGALRLLRLDRFGGYQLAAQHTDQLQLGLLTIGIGLVVLVVAAARRPARLAGAAALTLPVALVCVAGFSVVGFGG